MPRQLTTIAKNTTFIICGKIVTFALSFAFITGLANLTSKELAGSYAYVISILAITSITTLPGMATALTRSVARGHEGSIFPMMRLRIIWGSIGSFITALIGLFYFAKDAPILGWVFILAALLVSMTDTWSYLAFAFFQGKKEFKKSISLEVIYQALFSLPTLGILFITHNLIIIVISLLIFQTIAGILIYKTVHPANTSTDPESIKFGFHLTAIGALRTIAMNIDRVIIWHILGPVVVAIYTFASTPFNKLEQLVPIDMIALPDLSNKKLTLELRRTLFKRMLLLMLLVVPVIIIGIILTPFVFKILFPTFPESIPLFQLLLTCLIFTPFTLLKTGFTAWNKKRELYITETLSPIVRITLMIIFGYTWGIYGIIGAIALSRLIEGIIISILFVRVPIEIESLGNQKV